MCKFHPFLKVSFWAKICYFHITTCHQLLPDFTTFYQLLYNFKNLLPPFINFCYLRSIFTNFYVAFTNVVPLFARVTNFRQLPCNLYATNFYTTVKNLLPLFINFYYLLSIFTDFHVAFTNVLPPFVKCTSFHQLSSNFYATKASSLIVADKIYPHLL